MVKQFIDWLKALFVCQHDWRYITTVRDQNLRSGHKHLTDVYTCRRCYMVEHREKQQ